jgi:hypothetical protein
MYDAWVTRAALDMVAPMQAHREAGGRIDERMVLCAFGIFDRLFAAWEHAHG